MTAKGDIGSIIETKDIVSNNASDSYNCIKLSDGYYMMAFSDDDLDGHIATFALSESDGNIGGTVSNWEFLPNDTCNSVKLIKISGTTYAIVYSASQTIHELRVATFTVSDAGVITESFIESLTIPTTNEPLYSTDIIHISGNVYAIVYGETYTGATKPGFVVTVTITSAGVIGNSVEDSLQFTPTSRSAVSIVKVGTTDFYAIGFLDAGVDASVVTVDIDSSGTIANSVTATQVLTTSAGGIGNIVRVPNTNYYALPVSRAGSSGTIYTFSINSSGAITNGSNGEFDSADSEGSPSMIGLGSDAFMVAYRGVDNDGFLVTITIDSGGAVGSIIESLEFKTTDILNPFIIYLGYGNYAVTYAASDENDIECITLGVVTGNIFPSDSITRVTNLIHRYNRKEGVYELEMSLGEVTSDYGLPDWASTSKTLATNQEWEENMKRIIDDMRSYGVIPTPGQAPEPIGLGPLGRAAREEQMFLAPEPAPSRPSISERAAQFTFPGFTAPGVPVSTAKVTEERPVTDVQPGILERTARMFRLRSARPVSIEEEKAKFARLRETPKPKPVGITESIKRLMRFR